MSQNRWRFIFAAVCLVATAMSIACGGAGAAPISGYSALGEVSVTVTPAVMGVATTTTQTFTATVNNTGEQSVQWQVNGIPGGAPIIGTIDSSGNYTAPQFVPVPPTVTITAVANADSSKSGNAAATITGTLLPAQVFISPTGSAYVQEGTELKLSGGVTGPADTSVVWQVNGVENGNSKVGTITPGANNTAVYVAPAIVPNPPTVTVKAISHAEPAHFTSCAITLSVQPPTIATVTVTPVVAVDQAQTNFTFTADVINVGDRSVFWQVNGDTGGNQTDGTIASEGEDTGVYAGPPVVPLSGGAVSVTAISNAQPARSSSAHLSISPPAANGISVAVNGGTRLSTGSSEQITATVSATGLAVVTDPTVNWQVNGIPGGNSTYGTLQVIQGGTGNAVNYFSPAKVPVQDTVVVEAISNQDQHIVGTLPVQITGVAKTLKVSTPSGKTAFNLGINQSQELDATVSGEQDQTAIWYICVNLSSCTLNGNSALGTITPTNPADSVVYTAPPTVPNPSTLIIKAVSHADPSVSGTATVTIGLKQVITVQVTPSAPQQVETGLSIDGFQATVNGSADQTVTWQVCSTADPPTCYAGGNSVYGTMFPDSNFPNEEDYLAPLSVPDPAIVTASAIPEADPTVVSNSVPITIIPFQQEVQVTVDLQLPVILPTQADTVTASVTGTADQTVNWSLSLPPSEGGGLCTLTTCGSISPLQTDNTPATYTPPNPPPNDPWYVNITATSVADPTKSDTAQVQITNDATTSVSISPNPPPPIQAGSAPQFIDFTITIVNAPPDENADWGLGCITLAPPGLNCGKPFGTKGDGTGCLIGSDGFKLCSEGNFTEPGNTHVHYTPPPMLGNSQDNNTSCPPDPNNVNGIVPVTVAVGGNCPGNGSSCQAQVCVTVTPSAPKKGGNIGNFPTIR